MQELRLTPTSYIVMGLLDAAGPSTPYELKQMAATSVANFWSLQHAQFYTEPDRLTGAGYLTEERERGGRRRRHYAITDKGRAALAEWRQVPTAELGQLKEPALLKLFFGADPAPLAAAQLEAHRQKLAEYEAIAAGDPGDGPRGPWLALQAGIGHAREWIRFWSAVGG